jgi:hypothetical protein
MTSSNPRDPSSLRRALERASPAPRYDVKKGLARHRELLQQGATVPDWAASVSRARRFGGPWLLSMLAGLALLGALTWLSVPPERLPARPAAAEPSLRSGAAPVVRSVAPETAPRAASLPWVEPLPADVPSRHPPALPGASRATRARSVVQAEDTGAIRGEPLRAAATPSASAAQVADALPAPLPEDLVAELVAGGAASKATLEPTPAPEPVRSPAPDAIDPEVLDEMQQLASAERLLPTMPSRTLSMVRDGMQRFPHGYLAQERRYLEIMALLALKKPKDAELLSRGFLRDYPNGPYRRKVERALEEGKRN